MADVEEITPDHDQQEGPWEERTLNLLESSKIDQLFSEAKERKKGGKKHKLKWMKRPMAIPDVILEFLDEDLRENALRALSNFLVERREQDRENYYRAGILIYNSCATLPILLQEVVDFFGKMVGNALNVRSVKRVLNVLTLFQSVAANKETRHKFVEACIPNFLIPIILFESTIDSYDNLRAVALSVIGILCQGRETKIINWALEADLVEVCCTIIKLGNELSKVIAMHILESILQNRFGISHICDPAREDLLKGIMETWEQLVNLLAVDQDFSPRLLFHIIRCYIILCADDRGINIVTERLPSDLTNGTFHGITKEYPIIKNLLHQLLLSIGKLGDDLTPRKQLHFYLCN